MCRQQNRLRSLVKASGGLVLLAMLNAGPTAAVGGDTSPRNGPGGPSGGRISVGNLAASSPGNCAIAYSLQVQTEIGSGSDSFDLQIYDEAALIQTQTLSAPADGGVHALSGTLQIDQAVSQAVPGIGIYLVDGAAILDFVDPVDVTCGLVEIPTLDSAGALLLGALIFASALVLLRSRRSVR